MAEDALTANTDGLTPQPIDAEPAFSEYAVQGANGLLWIAYPLIRQALARFRERVGQLATPQLPFEAASAERLLLPSLFETLKQLLEPTLVLELNVARVQQLLAGEQPEDRFANFCERLQQTDVQLGIAKEYPGLRELLRVRATQWVDCSLELLERLSQDWELIRARLTAGVDPGKLTAIDVGAGDTHRGGRTVAILEFATGRRLVYKPHSQAVDVHFGELLGFINRAGFETLFRVLEIIDRGSYGWSEFVERKSCSDPEEVERFYRRLGGYLAVFYVTRARDMHFGNVIAAAEHPVPVDLEALFHNDVISEQHDPALAAFQSSVMSAMLLPQPMYVAGTDQTVDLSAFGASSDQPFPFGNKARWDKPGTDEMRLVREHEVPTLVARSRPMLNGREVRAEDFGPDFLAGFRSVYRLLEAHRDALQANGGWLERVAHAEVRFVARATAAYAGILGRRNQPQRLRAALHGDQLLQDLALGTDEQPHLTRLIAAEARDLQQGDVPVFTSCPDSRDLWSSDGERILDFFEQPAMALLREGLNRLGDADFARQEGLIRCAIVSLGAVETRDDVPASRRFPLTSGREAIDLARAVGDTLCRTALQNEAHASWMGVDPLGPYGQVSIQPLDLGLYGGLSGCALFLGYLAAVSGDASYELVARKTVTLLLRRLERGRTAGGMPVPSLGGFTGVGGVIYALTHLSVLWDDASLLDQAHVLAADIPRLVDTDETLDVIGGCAGAIAALAVLNEVSPSDALRGAAVACGERLLAKQRPQAHGAAWTTALRASQPLTGFSHGVAGIAWALLKLAAMSGQARFRAAALAALAYERGTFVSDMANWPDFRDAPGKDPSVPCCEFAWCHGAPGIALARIDGLPYMDDRETRDEIAIALGTTLAAKSGRNHCLCHGDLGNIDVLLLAAERLDDSRWRDAGERLARETLQSIAERGCRCGGQSYLAPPGLMVGLAGIGYGALRLARPDKVPSVLVLAPPCPK
jgi:type 2 lantibiotic biosynthesis protein LanM